MTTSVAVSATNESESTQSNVQSQPLMVIKRDGSVVPYDLHKIAEAIKKAIISVDDIRDTDETIKNRSIMLADMVHRRIYALHHSSGVVKIHIEEIQNYVQVALEVNNESAVATNYVKYRIQQKNKRKGKLQIDIKSGQRNKKISTEKELRNLIDNIGGHLELESIDRLITQVMRGIYEGVKYKDVLELIYMNSSALIQVDPNYTYLGAAALHQIIIDEVNSGYKHTEDERELFVRSIQIGQEHGMYDPKEIKIFDLNKLKEAIDPERNKKFTYLGLKTVYDRYLQSRDKVRYETPQSLFMRVSMGLAINEDKPNDRAIEFYNLLSSFNYMASTPTLFNSLTVRSQLSSCYLTTIPDSLEGIYDALKENAMLSKFAGGLGNDWTPVRALGSYIKGTNGESEGVIPFMKVANDTAVAVNQGGKRKGAVCSYLETWHIDIEGYLEMRKNTGDERRRTHDMNTANWIPDLFMERVATDGQWTLFSPNETHDLHDLYGKAFKKQYEHYESLADDGKIKNFKTVSAVELWKKMLGMLFETGHPWITFKDPCNIRSPQKHAGVVHSSNLCTEITLNTSAQETAVCNLGSINLASHINDEGEIDHGKLESTINTAMRMLDNVIDINFYPSEKARKSNMKHRPVGLGQMGFQDVLFKLDIPYSSMEAVELADTISEAISYYAIKASAKLAEQRGAYTSFEGSSWSKGQVPLDTIEELEEQRGKYIDVNKESRMDWGPIRKLVARGMRNSNTMAIAPTATISNITGLFQSIEPIYKHIYTKSNLSGEFTHVNLFLVKKLINMGLWDQQMIKDINHHEGLITPIERIPDEVKDVYQTAFEIEPQWLVEAASRRQKWIDQGQSLNLYMSEPSGKKLDNLYKLAWVKGLKTTYYLRSIGASGNKEDVGDTVNTQPSPAPQACSILEPECDVCQ